MSVKHVEVAKTRTKRVWLQLIKKRIAILLLTGAAAVPFAGCTAMTSSWQYNGSWNKTMMGQRNKSNGTKAWNCRKQHFCNEKYQREFSQGFKAGYMDVADGGTGCTPSFPPRDYWGWKYQSCEGQARVAAWFAGYPHGARAGEEDGIGNWSQIQTSSGIQQEYAQHGRLNQQQGGMYPISQSAVPNGHPQPVVGISGIQNDVYGTMQGYPVSIEQSTPASLDAPSYINQ